MAVMNKRVSNEYIILILDFVSSAWTVASDFFVFLQGHLESSSDLQSITFGFPTTGG
jgi:hypothetical protein